MLNRISQGDAGKDAAPGLMHLNGSWSFMGFYIFTLLANEHTH